jgi:WD40 repeat protein
MADQPTTLEESSEVSEPDWARRLGEVLAAYFTAAEAGQGPTPQELIARHPEVAREIAGFVADQERFGHLVASLRPVAQAAQAKPVALAGAKMIPPPSQSQGLAPAATQSPVEGQGVIADRDAPTLDQPEGPHLTADGNADADPDLALGTRVRYFGDYELRSVLGRGGMGVVYKAKQLSLNRLVALKMIRAGAWAGDEEVRRFRNEAEAVANLDHPQIVTIHEVGQCDGQHYFSMKLVDGPSLAERLDRYTRDPRSAAQLMAEVARAVHHAHQRGILHRDLKPSNILLDAEGRPQVTDFGLAKRMEGDHELSVSGAIVGTPAYMSPEQATGSRRAITTAADVYGLGTILYATLTGRAPFVADSVPELLEQVRDQPPERPSMANLRVDRDIETICLKCLEKDPRQRYDSPAALADDLERYLRGEPILARRAGAWERAVKWARRRPAGMSGIAALTLVGLGVALAYHSRLKAAFGEVDLQRGIAEAALARELTFLYQNRIMFAERELNDNTPHHAAALLEECPPAHRSWEWNYLKRQCHTELATIPAHKNRIWTVPVSPDGRLIATGADYEATIRIWEVSTGREVQSIPWDAQYVWCAISPDGSSVAAVGGSLNRPGSVFIHEVASGGTLRSIPVNSGYISSVAFSPDGQRIVIASGETNPTCWVKVYDVRTHLKLITIATGEEPMYDASFSPDGKTVMAIVGSNNTDSGGKLNQVRTWDAETGKARRGTFRGHTRPLITARFSPDGRRIAAAGYDATVRIYAAADSREQLALRGHRSCVNQVAFSPDSRRIASTSDDGSAKIWDAETGQERATLRGHRGAFSAIAFAPGGRRLFTSGSDGAVKLWDVTSSPEARTLSASAERVNSLAFNPNSTRLVTAGIDRTVRLWDVPSGQLVGGWKGHTEPIWGVAFNRDGTRVASAAGDWQRTDPGEVILWDATTGRILHRLRAHQGVARCVAFSPDGQRLVSAGGEFRTPGQEVVIWDVASGTRHRTISGLEAGVGAATFSPNGRRIAVGVGPSIQVWDAETGLADLKLEGHTNRICGLAFSPDGRLLASSSSSDGTIRIYDTAVGRLERAYAADKIWTTAVTFNPDGTRLASAGMDGTVKISDPLAGQVLTTLRGHADYVRSVAFSDDGRWIASSDSSGMVKIWDGSPLTGGAQ